MKIRIISDIHNEFEILNLPEMENENQQVLVLAGDVGMADKPYTYTHFLEEMSERFQDVIYIMGNHEFYGTSFLRGMDKVKHNLKNHADMPNVHVVNNETVRIENVSFVCSTLWTSYDNLNSLCMYNAKLHMNDHKKIRTGTSAAPYMRKFLPEDAFDAFRTARNFLFPNIKAEKAAGQKVVVVTQYASSLEEDIFESEPDLMIHGHTHFNFDYELVDEITESDHVTRIVCNPRGYAGVEENPDFNPNFVVDI